MGFSPDKSGFLIRIIYFPVLLTKLYTCNFLISFKEKLNSCPVIGFLCILHMKRTALIFILIAYAVSIFGIGVKEFYCCGKYVSSKLQYAAAPPHNCGMEEGAKGCCQTKLQFHKVGDNHAASSVVNAGEKHWQFLDIYNQVLLSEDFKSNQLLSYINSPHAPPLSGEIPIYIRNCVYRL